MPTKTFYIRFISKLIDKMVAKRPEEKLEYNDLRDSYQSAYRRGHSTEINPLEVHSDIAEALDEGSLIMVDISAGFDVIDHPILLKLLEVSFSIKENALILVNSYLTDRSRCMY